MLATGLAAGGAARAEGRRCSTSPTTRRASSTATTTSPSPSTGRRTGTTAVEIKTSHGGSGAQSRAVIDGLDAQVVTLALASDVNAIADKTGKIPADWQGTPAAQLGALHLDDRLPRPRRQPEGHRRLGRPREGRRPGHHPEPEDLGRGALELPRRLGLGREAVRRQRGPDPRLHARPLRPRAGARHRRPRLDDDLRAARDRRRAARLGERGLSRARGARAGPVRDRPAVDLDPRRADRRARRRQHRRRTRRGRRRRPTSTTSTAPRARRSRSSTTTAPGTRRRPIRRTSPASRSSSSRRSTTSAAGRRSSPSTSATAASSTRSTRPR